MGQQLFGEIVRRADLQSIQPVALYATRGSDAATGTERNLTLDESREFKLSDNRRVLSVVYSFDVIEDLGEAADAGIAIEPFRAGASFRLVYHFEPELTPEHDEAIKQFAMHNARFNAWPYLRAFLSRATAELEMPVFTLPLMKPYAPPATDQKAVANTRQLKARRRNA